MKKHLILKIIFIVEICLIVLFALGNVFNFFKVTPVLNLVYFLGDQLFVFGGILSSLLHINIVVKGISYTSFNSLVGLIIANVLFVILYYIIWTLVSYIVRKHNEDKLRSVVEKYELTKAEKARFRVRNYIHTFSPHVFISLIIPALFLTVLVTARFDEAICKETSSHLNGTLHFYSSYLEPALNSLFKEGDFHSIILSFFTRSSNNGYIDIMNVWFKDFAWVEYVVIVVACIFILFLWFIIFQALHLLVRKPIAKIKCNNARKAYIYKKEHQEYKIRKEYKNEISSKSDEFIRKLEEDVNSHADNIAKIGEEEDDEILQNPKSYEKNRKAYLEDIGYGVSDLGVSDKDIERVKPIVEREVRYISDEDIDIVLEEEPVIEIIEEEVDTPIENNDNDEFYEKYLPDETYEDEDKPLSEDVRDFIYENLKEDEIVDEDSLEDDNEVNDLSALEGNLPNEEESEEVLNETTTEEDSNVEEITEETPVEEPTEEEAPVEEITEEVTEEESEEVTEEGTKEPVEEKEETVEETPTEEVVEEETPVEQATEEEIPGEEVTEEVVEEPIEEKSEETTEEVTPTDVNEEIVEETPTEEVVETPVDETTEEVTKEETPIEEVTEEEGPKETTEEKEENTPEVTPSDVNEETPVEEPTEKVQDEPNNLNLDVPQESPETNVQEDQSIEVPQKKKKYNPFLKYTNTRKKGYGAKKVPTFKELSERKK